MQKRHNAVSTMGFGLIAYTVGLSDNVVQFLIGIDRDEDRQWKVTKSIDAVMGWAFNAGLDPKPGFLINDFNGYADLYIADFTIGELTPIREAFVKK